MDRSPDAATLDTLGLAVGIAAAYVTNNSLPAADLPGLIGSVHVALSELRRSGNAPPVEKASPAQIRRSVTEAHIVSFEDNRPYKTLRRHLTLRGLTPETYREKWGLPRDYPMTAASYSAERSKLARALGLGRPRPRAEAAQSEPPVTGRRRLKRPEPVA